MLWFIGQLLSLLLSAFGLGLLLGYVVWILGWRRRVESSTTVDLGDRPAEGGGGRPVPLVDGGAPNSLGRGRGAGGEEDPSVPLWERQGPDDLTQIEGIGPRMERALISAGITTYATLARSSEDVLREALELDGLRFAPSLPTWAKQAELLARGDRSGLTEYTATLRDDHDEDEG